MLGGDAGTRACGGARVTLQAVELRKYFPAQGGLHMGRPRGWVKALDGVSVQVGEGETLGVVGESGSGKTTLARLFLRLEQPTGGSVHFDGKALRELTLDELRR